MPVDREDEICQKALELLSDLCSKGEVQNENCLDFIYYFRDLARPRYSDSGRRHFSTKRLHALFFPLSITNTVNTKVPFQFHILYRLFLRSRFFFIWFSIDLLLNNLFHFNLQCEECRPHSLWYLTVSVWYLTLRVSVGCGWVWCRQILLQHDLI